MNEDEIFEVAENEEKFGVEDIEADEEALEQDEDEWAEEDIEDTIKYAQPTIILDFFVFSAVSVPIVLVFWLAIKAPPLAIGTTVFFSCLLVYMLYRSLAQKIRWKKVKGIVLPELKSKTAVHFHRISISVTDNYLVTWSARNIHVFKLCDVECLDGKKGMQDYRGRKFNDLLRLKRIGKAPKHVGRTVDYTEIDKANKLIKERKRGCHLPIH